MSADSDSKLVLQRICKFDSLCMPEHPLESSKATLHSFHLQRLNSINFHPSPSWFFTINRLSFWWLIDQCNLVSHTNCRKSGASDQGTHLSLMPVFINLHRDNILGITSYLCSKHTKFMLNLVTCDWTLYYLERELNLRAAYWFVALVSFLTRVCEAWNI